MVVLKYYIDNACDIIVYLSCISSKLMVVLKYYIDNACEKAYQESLYKAMKALEYIFKFIIRSRVLFAA